MASIRVQHTIDPLLGDMTRITRTAKADMAVVVKRNVRQGRIEAQKIAQAKAGPHGKNYHKRITDEMVDPLTGVYGPTGTVVENAVGASWRGGPSNVDLAESADIQGPRFAKDVADLPDKWFW